jgi:hypothetical protein
LNANMLRVQLATKNKHDGPLKGMTSAAECAIQSTVHGTTRFSLSQLVYQRDMVLRAFMEADVELVRQRRAAAIASNQERENRRRIAHI